MMGHVDAHGRPGAHPERRCGIVGAFIGGWLLAPMFGAGTINQNDFSVGGLAVSLLGAVILLAVVNLVRHGRVR